MPTKYKRYFPKPLLADLIDGRWLPVIGAGMSLNAKVPSGKKMPLWPELGARIAEDLIDFEPNGTIDAISAYQHEYGRARLIERLTQVLLMEEAQPGDAHRAFCSIPFDIVCTTNFDHLLERQYDATPRYVYPVVDEDQLSVNGSTAGILLLKLHGDLRHPKRLVVTEDDYDSFLTTYPLIATYLANQLITKTAVFIGYSLDDPDFRQLWSIVLERLGKSRRVAYAIMVDARPSDIMRFERRGVKVINLPGSKSKYGEILASAFDELGEYIRDNVIAASQVTEEEPLRELQLPRDSISRLCFFSIPLEMVAQYRSIVFPVVERLGYVPITADDVISPGDNINAKIDALIDRAAVMIVEPTSQWTRAEFDIAVARTKQVAAGVPHRHPLRIIVVGETGRPLPAVAASFRALFRGRLLSEEGEADFIKGLIDMLGTAQPEISKVESLSEPRRLLKLGENRASVISAMSELESWLRQKLAKLPREEVRRPMSLRQLMELALSDGVLEVRDVNNLKVWNQVRNEAVHTGKAVSLQTAKNIVSGIEVIIGR